MAALKKKIKKDSTAEVGLLSDADILSEVTEWIPSGFAGLDTILGGGWPVGRCVEIFGSEGAGKSALTHAAVKACQQMGGTVLYIDFETALDPEKLAQLQIDPKALIYCSPDTLEEGWDILYAMLDQLQARAPDAPTLIVWDSIAASVPAKLLSADAGDAHVALIARSMSANCGKVMRKIAKMRACLMWVNQERHKIGGFGFGEQYQTTGGMAVRYACSIRCQLRRRATLKQGETATGYLVQVRTVKNRGFPPHRQVTWLLDFREGPSPALTMMQHLKDARVLKSSKGTGFTAPWLKGGTIQADDWTRRYTEDADFREGADIAYAAHILPALRKGTRAEQPGDAAVAGSGAAEEESEAVDATP